MNDKQTEALKLALEALESAEDQLAKPYSTGARYAITAIREALADSALERMAKNAKELGLDYEPAQQQEPVATVIQFDGEKIIDASMEFFDKYPIGTELYTSPPASKPWVGLTAQEWLDVGCKSDEEVRVGLVIQAKLREKNAQPSKPLTDEQIKRLKPISADFVSFRAGVRCMEREWRNKPASKPWVGLVWGELPEDGHNHDFLRGAAWAETMLREKNA